VYRCETAQQQAAHATHMPPFWRNQCRGGFDVFWMAFTKRRRVVMACGLRLSCNQPIPSQCVSDAHPGRVHNLQVSLQNYIVGLVLLPASLPPPGAATVGSPLTLLAALETEDAAPPPLDALEGALTLALAPPAAGSMASSSAHNAAAHRAELLTLRPGAVLNAEALAALPGDAAAEACAAAARGCVVAFDAPALTVAGSYTATAAYAEASPHCSLAFHAQSATCAAHLLHLILPLDLRLARRLKGWGQIATV
jgi:hypothetical protein